MSKGPRFSATARASGPSSSLSGLHELLLEARWLRDPRQARGVRYRIGDVLSVIVVGVLCGCDDAEAIEQWAQHERTWLERHVPGLEGRVPSQDTILRMLALVRADAFASLLSAWARSFFGPGALDGGHIAIDGKSKRGSTMRGTEETTVHAVAAMLTGARIVLAEHAVDAKANEIAAAPDLLGALELRGALVSGDAMYTQTALAEQIVAGGGDYLLQVKANQPTLQKEISAFFVDALDERPRPRDAAQRPEYQVAIDDVEKAHGRLEQRIAVVANVDKRRVPCAERWQRIAAFILVFRWRVDLSTSRISNDAALYITSRPMTPAEAAKRVRAHWEIEALHHVLDVSYGEEAHRIASANAAHNLGAIRRLVQGLLGAVDPKRSVPYKRRECAFDPAYREKVLGRKR